MSRFVITIDTDNPDALAIVREATERIACQLDWGEHNTEIIATTENEHIASYFMEPGE